MVLGNDMRRLRAPFATLYHQRGQFGFCSSAASAPPSQLPPPNSAQTSSDFVFVRSRPRRSLPDKPLPLRSYKASAISTPRLPSTQSGGLGQAVGMRGLECGDRQDPLKLIYTVLVQIQQAEIGASPCLMLVQRLATSVEGALAGDANSRGLKCLANGTQLRLGHGCEPDNRSVAGPQERERPTGPS